MSAAAPEAHVSLRPRLEAIVSSSHVVSGTPTARRETAEPTFIVSPGSAAEVAELVQAAGELGAAIIPVGTAMRDALAEPNPGRARVFVDMQRLRHVLRLDETSLVVHVQAGLTAIELEDILAKRGLSLGDYPPSALGSTVGGLLAVRTPGKLSRRHGFIEDAVLGVSGVLADGRTVHTRVAPRRASGPDLARALCGSEGTLGIITSAVLRIHRRPEARFVAAYQLKTFQDALSAVRLALREEAAPAALRAYDHAAAALHFGVDVPALLLVATAGPTDLAACDRDLLTSAVTACEGEPTDEELAQRWWQARTGVADRLPAPQFQISATPGTQKAVYVAAQEAADSAGVQLATYASRFDMDGGVFFFSVLDAAGTPLEAEELADAEAKILAATHGAGAYLLGSGTAELAHYFEALRAELDPSGILNPGALVSHRQGDD